MLSDLDHEKASTDLLTILNENALSVIKKEFNKAENELVSQQNQIPRHQEALEKFCSKHQLLSQQAEVFAHESQAAIQAMRVTFQYFTKALWEEIFTLKESSRSAVDVCLKFIYMTLGDIITWSQFIADWAASFDKVYIGMKEFAPETLTEQQVSALLPIWKNYTTLSHKMKKYPKVLTLLLDWIRAGVEYKLKKEVLNGLKVKLAEAEQQKNEVALSIEVAQNTIQELTKRIDEYKTDLIYAAKLSTEEKKRFKMELVQKYKMQEQYSIVPTGANKQGNKIVLKNIKSSVGKAKPIETKEKLEVLTVSGRKVNAERFKELQELSSPQDCQRYLNKYIKEDLKGIIPFADLEQQLAPPSQRDSSPDFGVADEKSICERHNGENPITMPIMRSKLHLIVQPPVKVQGQSQQQKPKIFSPAIRATPEKGLCLALSPTKQPTTRSSSGGIKLNPFGEGLSSARGPQNSLRVRPGSGLSNKFEAELVPYAHATKPEPVKKAMSRDLIEETKEINGTLNQPDTLIRFDPKNPYGNENPASIPQEKLEELVMEETGNIRIEENEGIAGCCSCGVNRLFCI